MSEEIKVTGIHKKCGRSQLVRYGGGDITIWCNYCNDIIYDYQKEVTLNPFWIPRLWYWFKGTLKT